MLNPNGNESYTQEEYDAMAAKMGWTSLPSSSILTGSTAWLTAIWAGPFHEQKCHGPARKADPDLIEACGFQHDPDHRVRCGIRVRWRWKRPAAGSCAGNIFNGCIVSSGFWIAIVLIFIFAEQWKILPSSGISDGSGFILPAVTLALPSIGVCARLTRSAILDEIGRQYMTVADAKE